MRNKIFAFFVFSILLTSCGNDLENNRNSESILKEKPTQDTRQELYNIIKYFTSDEYQKLTQGLSKEEVQKDMAMILLPKCRQLLLENDYTEEEIKMKFNDDYKLIILEAFNLKK